MSQKEQIDLRERAYRLAAGQKGIMGTSSQLVLAEEIYRFLSKDLEYDPLRLDAPNPCPPTAHELWHGTYRSKIPANQPELKEIDWSRRQYVKNATADFVVCVDGPGVTDSSFAGTVCASNDDRIVVGYAGDFWKAAFVYFGEVHDRERPVIPGETSKAFTWKDMEQCFDESRLTHPMGGFKHDNFDDFIKWRVK